MGELGKVKKGNVNTFYLKTPKTPSESLNLLLPNWNIKLLYGIRESLK